MWNRPFLLRSAQSISMHNITSCNLLTEMLFVQLTHNEMQTKAQLGTPATHGVCAYVPEGTDPTAKSFHWK